MTGDVIRNYECSCSFFIIIARLRFPSGLSKVIVSRNRYGIDIVKNVRKSEKSDYKYHKFQLDLDFLHTCQHSNVIPTFLQFKFANRNFIIIFRLQYETNMKKILIRRSYSIR